MDLIVLDDQLKAVDVIDTYESLIWVDRYFECGDFVINGPMDEKILTLLRGGSYITTRKSKHCMLVDDISIKYDVESNLVMDITGPSLESIIGRRIVWKPTLIQGSFQDGIKKLINENIINPEQADRKIDNFIFRESEDPKILSLELNTSLYGDNLLEVIETVCRVHGVGFGVLLEDDKFVFELYFGQDRSFEQLDNPYVIFSPKYGNLISSDYRENSVNYKNVTLVAGQGEENRKTVTVGDAVGIERREIYTDAQDLGRAYYDDNNQQQDLTEAEYEEVLRARGDERLTETARETNFESELDDGRTYTYGEDYHMGDIVQVETGYGIGSRVRVTELIHSISQEGYSVYPTFTNLE